MPRGISAIAAHQDFPQGSQRRLDTAMGFDRETDQRSPPVERVSLRCKMSTFHHTPDCPEDRRLRDPHGRVDPRQRNAALLFSHQEQVDQHEPDKIDERKVREELVPAPVSVQKASGERDYGRISARYRRTHLHDPCPGVSSCDAIKAAERHHEDGDFIDNLGRLHVFSSEYGHVWRVNDRISLGDFATQKHICCSKWP